MQYTSICLLQPFEETRALLQDSIVYINELSVIAIASGAMLVCENRLIMKRMCKIHALHMALAEHLQDRATPPMLQRTQTVAVRRMGCTWWLWRIGPNLACLPRWNQDTEASSLWSGYRACVEFV